MDIEKFRPYFSEIKVRFRDLDAMGHINNAVFLSYIELARAEWLVGTGLGSRRHAHELNIILARSEIDFLNPGLLDDMVQVEAWLSAIGCKSFTMDYRIWAKERALLARSRAVLVWFDYQRGESMALSKETLAIMEQLLMAGNP